MKKNDCIKQGWEQSEVSEASKVQILSKHLLLNLISAQFCTNLEVSASLHFVL